MDFDLNIDNIKDTEIRKSNIHGWGLYSLTNIAINTVLCELDGQIVPYSTYSENEKTLEWNALENDMLMVRPYRTKYSFINHSRTPNAKIAYKPIRVICIKSIDKGEEITIDYRMEALPEKYLQEHGKTYL
jgi:SET domain-containing protein